MDDQELWDRFSAAQLPANQWTHRAHLRVAWLFLERHALDEAHIRMRIGIVRLNAFHGLVETPQRGYHETMTRFWLVLISSLRRNSRARTSDAFVGEYAEQLTRDAPMRHYSRERLMSVEARAVFVTPDLAGLPNL